MRNDPATEELFADYATGHYLGNLLSRISLPPLLRAILIASLSYLLFLLWAAACDWNAVMSSFLHRWQISFSVTIFLGLWLWIEHAGLMFAINDIEFSAIAEQTGKRLGSKCSSLMALPLIAGALGIAVLIASNSPNKLFPYPGYVPAFLYAVFVELCLVMLHLLGATGFWLLYVFTTAARELSKLKSVKNDLVHQESMKYLSDTVLRLCSYLFVIIASAMPGVAYVVFSFKSLYLVLFLGILFGVALPTVGLTLSFFVPIYYLHTMMAKAKKNRLLELRRDIRSCEQKSREHRASFAEECDELQKHCKDLREKYLKTQRESVWPFDTSSLLKLFASSMLPILTFSAQHVSFLAKQVGHLLSP